MKHTVLILCTGNSARSQMAEALVDDKRGDKWQAFSAGTHPAGFVHPDAVAALREIGIDIEKRGARSKSVDEFRGKSFDVVITVCDDAAEECPVWLGHGQREHIGFPDPAKGTLDDFRSVRDGIQAKVIGFLDDWESLHALRRDNEERVRGM
jgi:arsenate reductase (thioredoxin)